MTQTCRRRWGRQERSRHVGVFTQSIQHDGPLPHHLRSPTHPHPTLPHLRIKHGPGRLNAQPDASDAILDPPPVGMHPRDPCAFCACVSKTGMLCNESCLLFATRLPACPATYLHTDIHTYHKLGANLHDRTLTPLGSCSLVPTPLGQITHAPHAFNGHGRRAHTRRRLPLSLCPPSLLARDQSNHSNSSLDQPHPRLPRTASHEMTPVRVISYFRHYQRHAPLRVLKVHLVDP